VETNAKQFLLANGFCCKNCQYCFKNYYGEEDYQYHLFCDKTNKETTQNYVCNDCDIK